jgi:hypothetical protein
MTFTNIIELGLAALTVINISFFAYYMLSGDSELEIKWGVRTIIPLLILIGMALGSLG